MEGENYVFCKILILYPTSLSSFELIIIEFVPLNNSLTLSILSCSSHFVLPLTLCPCFLMRHILHGPVFTPLYSNHPIPSYLVKTSVFVHVALVLKQQGLAEETWMTLADPTWALPHECHNSLANSSPN